MRLRDRLIESLSEAQADAVLHLVRHPTPEQLEAGLRELDASTLRIEWHPRCYGDSDLCLKRVFRAILEGCANRASERSPRRGRNASRPRKPTRPCACR
jgi:hypothetical protein